MSAKFYAESNYGKIASAAEGRKEMNALIIKCPRCEGSHESVVLTPLSKPIIINNDSNTHWGLCPTLNEPVFMAYGTKPRSKESPRGKVVKEQSVGGD